MKRKTLNKGLDAKYETFCQKYLLFNFNGTRAILATPGFTKEPLSAGVEASNLLNKINIKNRIQELITEQEERYAHLRHRLIEELSYIAFSDQRKLSEWGSKTTKMGKGKAAYRIRRGFVNLINSKDLSDADAKAVAEVSQTVNGVALKCHSKEKALELLGRHLKLWDGDQQPSNKVGVSVEVSDKALASMSEEELNKLSDAVLTIKRRCDADADKR